MAKTDNLGERVTKLEENLKSMNDLIFTKKGDLRSAFVKKIPHSQWQETIGAELPTKNIEDYIDPSKGEIISDHYQYKILDCIIDTAFAVSKDYALRPDSYKKIGVSPQLIFMRRFTGNVPFFPDKLTRVTELYKPYFGELESTANNQNNSGFYSSAKNLMLACKAYSENKLQSTTKSLSERVKIANQYFRSQIEGLFGSSQIAAMSQVKFVFHLSIEILMDQQIQNLFGVSGGIPTSWPLEPPPNSNGAILIQNISTRLNQHMPQPIEVQMMDKFINKQLISIAGKNSIKNSFEDIQSGDPDDPNSTINKLVASVYSWGSELGMI